MTDRIKSLTVALAEDMRDDDAAGIVAAIGHIKGVVAVTGEVVDLNDFIAQNRMRHEIGQKIMDVLYPPSEYSAKRG